MGNGSEPFSLKLERENVSIFDRITVHRISTKSNDCVVGEVTMEIGDCLIDCAEQNNIYEFDHLMHTHPLTMSHLVEETKENKQSAIGEEEFQISDAVIVRKRGKGIVRFVGKVKFAQGTMFGIELESENGTNNGSIKGEQYFRCRPKHGIFVRSASLKKSSIEMDEQSQYKMNDCVQISKKGKGIIRYIGPLHFLPDSETVYGIALEQAIGKNNGSVKGQKYFECAAKHGIFCKKEQIKD